MKMKDDVQGKSTETNIDVFRGVRIKLYEKRAIVLMTGVQSDEQ